MVAFKLFSFLSFSGNHPEQIANQLLEEEVFFVNKETINHAGDKLARCLETWVEEDCDESGTNKVRKLQSIFPKDALNVARFFLDDCS